MLTCGPQSVSVGTDADDVTFDLFQRLARQNEFRAVKIRSMQETQRTVLVALTLTQCKYVAAKDALLDGQLLGNSERSSATNSESCPTSSSIADCIGP